MYKSAEGHSSKQKFTFGLVAIVYFLTACGGPVSETPRPTEGPILLPPGITANQMVPLPPEESGPLITEAGAFFEATGCKFPKVEVNRVPAVSIAPGVVQDAYVVPGDPTIIGLATHAGLSTAEAQKQDKLDIVHEFIHICESRDLKPADRSKMLFDFLDKNFGIRTQVYPTTRFINPGLTADVFGIVEASGEQQLLPIAGSLEELFAHSIIDYLLESKGETDLLKIQRNNDPFQPGINFVRNALTTKAQMQDAINKMGTDDSKGAFDLLYGAMLRRGLSDGLITMQDGGVREQEMKFFFFLMLMRISNKDAPYAFDTANYELDVKDQMSGMFYGIGKKFSSLTPEQGAKINAIYKDMFLKTPVLPASSRKQKFVPMKGFGPNGTIVITKQLRPGAPRWDIRSQKSQLLPSKHSGS